MPAVFVHGVPETPAVWGPLLEHLDRTDVVLVQLPGFGCALPDGFEPVKETYAQWLAGEVAAAGPDVDLVAHDWGALLAMRVLADRPANVRSWVADCADLEGYEWHEFAKLWQTPGEGEAFWQGAVESSPEDRAALLAGSGVPADATATMAAAVDETMATAILGLYRSAVDIGAEWSPGIDRIEIPGLVIDAPNDPFRPPGGTGNLARRLGVPAASPPDAGHWWMLSHPADSARILSDFWSTLD